MPLLARQLLIGDQPAVHDRGVRLDRRLRPPRVLLARRRQRRRQGLAHRAPMHPMSLH
jgi:hypothetical protein